MLATLRSSRDAVLQLLERCKAHVDAVWAKRKKPKTDPERMKVSPFAIPNPLRTVVWDDQKPRYSYRDILHRPGDQGKSIAVAKGQKKKKKEKEPKVVEGKKEGQGKKEGEGVNKDEEGKRLGKKEKPRARSQC